MASWTQAQLDALTAAIADGATRVKYADKEVEYRSLREMLALRDLMKKSLGQLETSGGRVYPSVKKGLES